MTFAKMGFRYSDEDVDGIVNFKPLAVENALRILRVKVEMYIRQKHEMRGNNYTSQLQEAYGQQGAQQPGNSGSPPRLQAELPEIKQRGNAKAKTRNGILK